MPSLLLLVLGAFSILSGLGVVFSRSAVNSALCLTLNLLIMAVLFLKLSLQFLGVAQIVIYAGAIMVVFLFAVTVLAPEEEVSLGLTEGNRLSGVVVGLVIGFCLVSALVSVTLPPGVTVLPPSTVSDFAGFLFGRFVLPFEGTAFILLVALIGAVLLGQRRLRG